MITTNPAKHVTQTTDFVGQPVGDLSDDVRLKLAEEADKGSVGSSVTWELDGESDCGFAYLWNTPTGALGEKARPEDGLCERSSSVDYYSIEGVDTLTPAGMDADCGEQVPISWFYAYRFCEYDLTSHVYDMSLDNITVLGLLEGSSVTDVELLFSTSSLSGVYESAEQIFECEEPVGLSVECEIRFNFWGSPFSEVRNTSVQVRSSILGELEDLADSAVLPDELSEVGMVQGICDAVASTEELIDCSISCSPTYPYSSSSCVGTYEVSLVKEVPHRGAVILVMAIATIVSCLSLGTLRVGMRTAHGRSRRGYLGPGGSAHHYFEETGDCGDRIGLANPIPPMRVANVSTQGTTTSTTFLSFSRTGFPICRERIDERLAAQGIVVCQGVKEIPREAFMRTGAPVALGEPRFGGSSGNLSDSSKTRGGAVPICFMVQEKPDGSLTNLDVEAAHRLLDKSSSRALLDESFGGNHLAWARGFSVVDALGCLLTLWTVHFVAANSGWGSFYWVAALVALGRWLEETDVHNLVGPLMGRVQVTPKIRQWSAPPLPISLALMEVLYDLSIPRVEVIGLFVTALWTLVVVASCGYFIYILGYEPVYYGGGLYSTKVSLATALAVGGALNCPFALAGDWVRGSRCGDLGGRLAVSFCLGSPQARDGTRVSHVNSLSDLRSTLETGVLCGDGAIGE